MTLPTADPPTGRVDFHDLSAAPDPSLLRRAYTEILEPSFPSDELDGFDELTGRLSAGEALVGIAVRDGVPVGVVVVDRFDRSEVLLLSYLAVRPGTRGGGVGAALLRAFRPAWQERLGADLVVAEIEDPRFHTTSEFGDPAARLRFYQREGYLLAPGPFVQPRVSPDDERVAGMLLAVAPGHRNVSAGVLTRFITDYFESAEGPGVHDDPVFNALVSVFDGLGAEPVLLAPERHTEIPPLDVPVALLSRDYPMTAVATDLLGVSGDQAVAVLDDIWRRVLARMAAGERIARPRVAVLAELVDALADADLLQVSQEPADSAVLSWWFAGEDDPWAGWWRQDPPVWTEEIPLSALAVAAVRRLPPLPRVAVVLSDVLGLTTAEAVSITGQSADGHRALVAAARTELVALIDQELIGGRTVGQLPAV